MIKEICKDPLFLSIKSKSATIDDLNVAKDLLDTLTKYSDVCVGMAANMIGVSKRIIVFYDESINSNVVMFNPTIVSKNTCYDTEEGCLSLPGVRKTKRYKNITVEYQDLKFKKQKKNYSGFTAQIIQHEIDMTCGILI